jgi:AcrR family transcriptional regulator
MPRPTNPRPSAEARRESVLDAAEKVMIEKGYGAVTSRSVGAAAGMAAPNVHYYFPTLDDLFIALLRRGLERSETNFLKAIESSEPLHALWASYLDPRGTSLTGELVALSNHRPAVRAALVEISDRFNRLQVTRLLEILERYDVDTERFPPDLVILALGGISRSVIRNETMGRKGGHRQALAAVERLIDEIEPQGRPRRRAPRAIRSRKVAN